MENELEFDKSEYDKLFGSTEQDIRGPSDDATEEGDPVGDHRKSMIDEVSRRNAGTVPDWVPEQDLSKVLGITTDEDVIVKSEPEPVEEVVPLVKLSEEDEEFARTRELYKAMYA